MKSQTKESAIEATLLLAIVLALVASCFGWVWLWSLAATSIGNSWALAGCFGGFFVVLWLIAFARGLRP